MKLNKRFAAHPIQVINYLEPFAFVLLIPLSRAIIGYFLRESTNRLFLYEIILAVIIIGYAIIKWRHVAIFLIDDALIIKSGFLILRTAKIKINKISSIKTTKNLTDRVFRSVTFQINTESGAGGGADFKFKLYQKDAEIICREIFPQNKTKIAKFSVFRVALMVATASSAFAGFVFIVPLIKKLATLLGAAAEKVIMERINQINSAAAEILPPVINTITIIFLLLYAVSFLVFFLKYANFRVRLSNGIVQVVFGLITRSEVFFNINNVNSVTIEGSPLTRVFGRCFVRVNIGGYGDNNGRNAVVIPAAKPKEVYEVLGGHLQKIMKSSNVIAIKPQEKSRKRFYFIPTLCLTALLTGYCVFVRLFPMFFEVVNFLFLILFSIILYHFALAEYNFKNSKVLISNVICEKYSTGTFVRETVCDAYRIGFIHITRWPRDLASKTCNIRFIERNKNAETIKIKHIPYAKIKTSLSEVYDFKYE